MSEPPPFPVLCARCRAEGAAGEGEFIHVHALGDLLEFQPVPLQVKRVDGHSPEGQRAFIAALAVLGSPARAADAIGRSAAGLERLRKLPGSEGFNRAWDRAMEIHAEKERARLADSLSALTRAIPPAPAAAPEAPVPSASRSAGLSPPEDEEEERELTPDEERLRLGLIRIVIDKYLQKLETERRCRLEGRIAEADFCLRQVTMLEVSLDVLGDGDGMAMLKQARLGDHGLLDIAETQLSRLLDEARRLHWQECGDPPRPEYPPRHLLVDKGGYAIEPIEAVWGGLPESFEEQRHRLDEQCRRDAKAQVEWEAKARRDYEARSSASKTDGT